jgi:hypothetical protein
MWGKSEGEFEQTAGAQGDGNILTEFWYFARTHKKLWMLPILLVLLAFGGLMLLSGTAVAPFIYTLF